MLSVARAPQPIQQRSHAVVRRGATAQVLVYVFVYNKESKQGKQARKSSREIKEGESQEGVRRGSGGNQEGVRRGLGGG